MDKPKQIIKLTEAQRRAVETVGCDVLVTASAGTGKTAALSLRCVARVCDTHQAVDVDRLLVLTFTDAAAEEMRERIGQTLRAAAREKQDSRLRQQAILLDVANISTIHAFCKRTLTEFFHAADIDPAFGIIDADEQRLLKSETLEAVLEAAWQEPELAPAMRELFAGRRLQPGTRSFVDKIIPLSAFLDSVADREAFYEQAARLNDATDAAYTALLNEQKAILCDALTMMRQRLDYALALDAHYCGGGFISKTIQTVYIPQIESCRVLAEQGRLDRIIEMIETPNFGRFPNKPKDLDKETADFIKASAAKVKKEFSAMKAFAVLNPGYAALTETVSQQSRTLLGLVRRFDAAYAAAKAAQNVLDFADLEHHTLRLLENNADIAAALRERFEYVFVDEYQDINTVQQRILDCLCRGDNVFAVGDVKQSIYAFRQSRPEIFLTRLKTATDRPETADKPLRVDMAENFRSRKEVLDFVNAVFGRIMTDSAAKMQYDQRAMLKAQFEYAPFGSGHPVELVILDEESDGSDEAADDDSDTHSTEPAELIDAAQRQAAFIAHRIRQMVGADGGKAEFQVYDRTTGGYRDVRYGDIVILMRSLSHKANTYVEILRLAQIPVNSQSACGYFETTEISDCLSLLKTLDNPDGDIELAATLRSPLFGFDDTALVTIRFYAEDTIGRKKPFYQAVKRYAEDGPDATLRKAVCDALRQLDQWRQTAQHGNIATLLDEVFRTTGLLAFYAALPNGAVRRANLLKLHDRAVQFEQFRTSRPGMGLARFVEFLEKLQDQEQDWAPGQPDSMENAVRVMSVHKSKGLEFPVVFAAELNTRFNMTDTVGECLIDEDTIGLQAAIEGGRFRLSSATHQVLAERKRRQTVEEEMRILYVMLTRAREKLVLTASHKADLCRQRLIEGAMMTGGLAEWKLVETRRHLDWILAALADEATLHTLFETECDAELSEQGLFVAQCVKRQELDGLTTRLLDSKRSLASITTPPKLSHQQAAEFAARYEQLEATLTAVYPFEDVCGICAKYSVSTLTHRDDEFSPADVSGAFDAIPATVQAGAVIDEHIGRRLAGTAAHRVFEHLPLEGSVTPQTAAATLSKLVGEGIIAPAIAWRVDTAAIAAFFDTEPGQAALAAGTAALREWPFTLAVDAMDIVRSSSFSLLSGEQAKACTTNNPTNQGEIVIVQGIVDLIIPTADGLIVADFKTDRIRDEAALQQRTTHYREPLAWYARAAAAILNKPVVSSWLYFADCRKAVRLL